MPRFFSFMILFCACAVYVRAQQNFYDVETIQQIELFFAADNWDYQLDTAKLGADDYTLADSVRINGTTYAFPGVKYKGNSSYDSTFAKNPLHISLDEFVEQDYQGHSSIKLSNAYADPSMVREVLAYEILRNYMHAPQSNFAQVYVNGNYLGLYSNDQHVGKNFCEDHFQSADGVLIKGNPIVTPGPTTKSNLKYIDGDSTSYMNYYELKSDWGWNELVELCDVLSNNPTAIADYVDVDRMLWMLAFNSVMVNLDSYSGVFAQNYYLYQDTTGRFNPVVWDLNMCFGGFPFLGSGNSSMGSLDISQLQAMPIVVHGNDSYWPLIKALMNDPMYRRMYLAHVRTIASEMIASGNYEARANVMQQLISGAVYDDANKFFSDSDFDSAMESAVDIGNYEVSGLVTLMNARSAFLSADAEYTLSSPVIASWQSSDVTPDVGESFYVTATASGAQSVWIGKRHSTAAKFVRIPMLDDGAHGDDMSGDGVYGAQVTMSGDSMQFYIYAENADAGVFSPARAEHEFHAIFSSGVDIREESPAENIGAYPNPASNLLYVPCSAGQTSLISVYDAMGHCVVKTQTNQNLVTLDVSALPAGMYILAKNHHHQCIQIIHDK
ncbi:MAG: CotH kinase family protein [Flavobacteriales bacterium]|jgi:hypothetical protein